MAKLTLLVLRHAKSDWSTAGIGDHERPLNGRGKREAPITGDRLAAAGLSPQLVLSSDARRTQDTWERIAGFFPGARVTFHRELYLCDLADVAALLPVYATADDRVIMVVGHNPGFQEMVLALTGQSLELKTATCAVITGEAEDWRALLARRDLELAQVITPKDAADPE